MAGRSAPPDAEMAAALIACGLDGGASVHTRSHVRAHAELAWIFNCVARLGWLNHMTQFKDKAGRTRKPSRQGCMSIEPDGGRIHAYHATKVPVGDDRSSTWNWPTTSAKFNHDYGVEFFPNIEPLIRAWPRASCRCAMGPEDVEVGPSDQSRINLTDDADTISQKIKRAKTDPERCPSTWRAKAGRRRATLSAFSPPSPAPCRSAARTWRGRFRRVQIRPRRCVDRASLAHHDE